MHSGSQELIAKASSACPVCSQNAAQFLEVYDDRYAYPGLYRLYRCSNCGHTFLPVHFTAEEMARLYTDYYPRSSYNLDDYRPAPEVQGFASWLNGEHSAAYAWVPRKVRVLDIGCGFGETLGYHKARGCDVYGVEADQNIKRVADRYGFNVRVGVFDAMAYEPEFFDYVTLSQVIEHLPDPVATLQGVARILKQDGIAILSTPNAGGWGGHVFGRRWVHWHAPYHCQFFSRQSMNEAAAQAGLKVKSVRTITSSEWLLYQWLHLLTRPAQGKPSAFWSPKVARTGLLRLAFACIMTIHYAKIDHLISRLFDAMGAGDNYLFILKKA